MNKLSVNFRRQNGVKKLLMRISKRSKQMRSRIYYFTAIGLISGFKASNEMKVEEKTKRGKNNNENTDTFFMICYFFRSHLNIDAQKLH